MTDKHMKQKRFQQFASNSTVIFGQREDKISEQVEHVAENILHTVKETFADNGLKEKFVRFAGQNTASSSKPKKIGGREKSVHNILGGGKSADILLWRNKKISSSVLASATAIWILFEWLNYNFLALLCFGLAIGMVLQFVMSNASGILNRSPSDIPRLVLPEDMFVNIAVYICSQINLFLGYVQDIACGRNLKQFLGVVAGLLVAAVIGSWCNFLTVIYIGFVAAHTLPVLYEKYEDQVDDFLYGLFGQLQSQYQKVDLSSVLSKIPKGNIKAKKSD